jgi:hypothetical protein
MVKERIGLAFESGEKKTFAIAVDWPGWCRSGREDASALQALVDYAPRYAKVMELEKIPFAISGGIEQFTVTERVAGTKTTDYGAPDIWLSSDDAPLDKETLARLQTILRACWRAFAEVVESAAGKSLRTGPRGGGRDVDKMVSHVVGAETAYLARLGWKLQRSGEPGSPEYLEQIQQAGQDGLAASARGELPKQGPRGGKIWPARFYVRRSAWHILDHAWEIEDRM